MTSKKIEINLESPWALMNPGPINLKDSVRLALLRPDLCHREVEFQELLENVREKIRRAFEISEDYTIALLAGSGTAAVEAMIVSGMPREGKLLSIENGVYGERISKIARAAGIEVIPFQLDWGEPVDLDKLRSLIQSTPGLTALSAIHNETTTGLLNPVEAIGQVARENDLLYFVDTVSGMAAEEIDIEKCGITIAASTANKGIHSVPGISFAVIRRDWLAEMEKFGSRSVYFDLANYVKCQDKGTIPFTMPVHVMYAFDVALDELIAETVPGRLRRFRERADRVRDDLADQFDFYIPRDKMANTMTAMALPEGVTYEEIHDALKKEGIIIYAGQGGLVKSIFRVAHLGEYDDDTVLPRLSRVLKGFARS